MLTSRTIRITDRLTIVTGDETYILIILVLSVDSSSSPVAKLFSDAYRQQDLDF